METLLKKIYVLLAGALLLPVAGFGQLSVIHTPAANLEKSGIASLSFKAPGIQQDQLSEAYLIYFFDTNPTPVRKPATFKDDTFTIDIDLQGSKSGMMSYAFYLEMSDGSKLSFPEQNPESNPVAVALTDPQVTSKSREGKAGKIDFTVLTPEPGVAINPSDFVVAITLFYKEGDAKSEDFRLKINGTDVTAEADITPYLISWIPKEPLKDGNVQIELSMKNAKGGFTSIVSFKSKVSKAAKPDQEGVAGATTVIGNGELSARNQTIAGSAQDIYRGSFNMNVRSGNMRFSANGLATSLEDERLQPQNRLAGELYLGKWFELQAGHIYPKLNSLILNGRRVYGVNTGIYLFNRNIGFQALYGEMNRKVDNLYSNVLYNPQYTILSNGDTLRDANNIPVSSPSFDLDFQSNGAGTHSRKVWGGRFNLGNGRLFGFGISGLKVEDDTTSILNVKNLETLPEQYLSGLTTSQRDTLRANPTALNILANNAQPKGNFLLATDLSINGPKGRFRFNAEGAANLLNEDISPGVLNKERAADLGFSDFNDDVSDLLDRLAVLIIINENLRALPVDFSKDKNGEDVAEVSVTKITGLLAGQANLALNVLGNNITAQYMWMGPDFTPLSNSAVRRDIKGFTVNDRLRFFRNRLYITAGYESFEDNLLGNLDATTATTSYRAGIGVYPFKSTLPRINFNYRFQNRDNGVSAANPLLSQELSRRAVRSFVQVTADSVRLLATPKFTDTDQFSVSISQQATILGSLHDVNAGFTSIDTRDREFLYGNFHSDIYNVGLGSRWRGLPLKTQLNANWNYSDALSGNSSIDIFGLSAGFEMLLLKEKLQVNADVAVSQNKITNVNLDVNTNGTDDEVLDDYFQPNPESLNTTESVSYVLNASARYNFNKYHALAFSANYTKVENKASSFGIPRDQIVQMRYIINF